MQCNDLVVPKLWCHVKIFNIAMLLISKYLHNNCNKGGFCTVFHSYIFIFLHVSSTSSQEYRTLYVLKKKHLLNHGKAHDLSSAGV